MKKKVMVIDAYSLLYKAFYGVRPMHASDGTPTNAIYGFINMLLKLIRDYSPEYLFAAFDAGKKNFRMDYYPEYKDGRQSMPEELSEQVPIITELLKHAGVHFLSCENYEADDILGYMGNWAQINGHEAILVTGDRDSFQLANESNRILYTKRGVSDTIDIDPNYIAEEYGLQPTQLIDVKALMGDKSDNIPGVAGVGEKTALKLITEYGDLDTVYQNIDLIKGKLKEKLLKDRDMAYLSKDLVTIRKDIPLEVEADIEFDYDFSSDDVVEQLTKLEMKQLVKQVGGVFEQKKENQEEIEYQILENQLPKNMTGKIVSVLLGSETIQDGMSFALAFDEQVFIVKNATIEILRSFSEDPEIRKVTHQFKDLYKKLAKFQIKSIHYIFDTYLAGYVANPSDERYELEYLSKKYLEYVVYDHEKEQKQTSFFDSSESETNEKEKNLAENCKINLMLFDKLHQKLEEDNLIDLYDNIEHKLLVVLAEIELEGFRVDVEMLQNMKDQYDERIEALTKEIRTIAGKDDSFNINSPKQLGELLFQELNLPIIKKTKTGYSTDIEVLTKLKDKHEIIPLIIEIRKIAKLNSTYIKGMLQITDPITHKIHTTFNQTVASTGRISSSEPNLQNIPIRTEEGREIRKIFIASSDENILVDADYSQIELRILAHIANDENMIRAFMNNEDIHARTASQVFDVDIDQVTPLQRRRAKAVNFGIVYGISDYGLSRSLEITRSEAKAYIEKYLNVFSGVRQYMEDIVEQTRQIGYVTTLFGRRRYIPDIHSKNYNIRSFAERTALNTPIQGSAADIIKIAMVKVFERLNRENMHGKLILQIHDELIVDCPISEEQKIKAILIEEMQNAANLDVPLTVDIASGKNWYDAK